MLFAAIHLLHAAVAAAQPDAALFAPFIAGASTLACRDHFLSQEEWPFRVTVWPAFQMQGGLDRVAVSHAEPTTLLEPERGRDHRGYNDPARIMEGLAQERRGLEIFVFAESTQWVSMLTVV